jgi:hypothetical protein
VPPRLEQLRLRRPRPPPCSPLPWTPRLRSRCRGQGRAMLEVGLYGSRAGRAHESCPRQIQTHRPVRSSLALRYRADRWQIGAEEDDERRGESQGRGCRRRAAADGDAEEVRQPQTATSRRLGSCRMAGLSSPGGHSSWPRRARRV